MNEHGKELQDVIHSRRRTGQCKEALIYLKEEKKLRDQM